MATDMGLHPQEDVVIRPPARDRVLAALLDGVEGVRRAAMLVDDWGATTPCDEWDAGDLAGHLLSVAHFYIDLLRTAAAGRPRRGLPAGPALREANAARLAAVSGVAVAARIGAYLPIAEQHARRAAAAEWSLVMGEWDSIGELTVGQHTGLAAGEWHLHAWDLARAAGGDHRPAEPEVVAAGRTFLLGQPPAERTWEWLLEATGRAETWRRA